MSIEIYYTVARDSETGTWFTTDTLPSVEGSAYDTDTEEWAHAQDVAPEFDTASFTQLSAMLDELNKRNTKFLPIVG